MLKNIVLFIMLFAFITACKKNKEQDNIFINCNKLQNLDSLTVGNKLLGTWLYTKKKCFDGSLTSTISQNIKVVFKTNRTYTVITNGTLVLTRNWSLKPVDITLWGLTLLDPDEYLNGGILFCGENLLFYNSFIDGCDNLFIKSN